MFLPITPRICAWFVMRTPPKELNKYIVIDMDVQNAKYVNYILKENAIKELAYHSNDINHLISSVPDEKKWVTLCSAREISWDF